VKQTPDCYDYSELTNITLHSAATVYLYSCAYCSNIIFYVDNCLLP